MNNVKYYKLNENGEVTSISESNIDSLSNTVDSSYIEINESERESLVKVISSGDLVYKNKSGSWASVQYNKYVKIIDNEVQYNTEKLREDKITELHNIKEAKYIEPIILVLSGKQVVQKTRQYDLTALSQVYLIMMMKGVDNFKGWKVRDLNGNEIFITISKQDISNIVDIITNKTTFALAAESFIVSKMLKMSYTELMNINLMKEYDTTLAKVPGLLMKNMTI